MHSYRTESSVIHGPGCLQLHCKKQPTWRLGHSPCHLEPISLCRIWQDLVSVQSYSGVKMNIIWMTVTLMSLILLAAANSGTHLKCLDMPFHRITTRGSVSVSCPNVTGIEVKFQLWGSNESKIGSATRKLNVTETEGPVEFREQDPNRTAYFVLSQLNVSSTGIYTCVAERLYPPPYSPASTCNIVSVEEQQTITVCPAGESPKLWIWAALATMALYSITITSIAVVLWHNLRNKQNLQHDYMNMKPRALRKKQGVQHPVRSGRLKQGPGREVNPRLPGKSQVH
ncbi:hypothetical protein GJAV_G00201990 [Gymnothorax javanicus]|nr:hypothetical protein GJAV_G00201990 [Gymnothorax javanicus]